MNVLAGAFGAGVWANTINRRQTAAHIYRKGDPDTVTHAVTRGRLKQDPATSEVMGASRGQSRNLHSFRYLRDLTLNVCGPDFKTPDAETSRGS